MASRPMAAAHELRSRVLLSVVCVALVANRVRGADPIARAWVVGQSGQQSVYFVPTAGTAGVFPNGHEALITVATLSGANCEPQDSAPVSLTLTPAPPPGDPLVGTAAGGRLPAGPDGFVAVAPTDDPVERGECKIRLTFNRHMINPWQESAWLSVPKWVATKVTPIELSFTDDIPLKTDEGATPIPNIVYRDSNADGDTDDSGEWDYPVCFEKERNPNVTVKFRADPPLTEQQKVWMKGEGLGTGDEAVDWDDSRNCIGDELEFPNVGSGWFDEVADHVKIGDAKISWRCCIKSSSPDDGEYASVGDTSASKTDPTKLYILFNEPQTPMQVPWTEVLDYACDWAEGATDEEGAMWPITHYAHWVMGWYAEPYANKSFDGTRSYAMTSTFHLKSFLNDSVADCRDMSAFVYVCVRALGGTDVKTQGIMGSFRFNQIRTIGEVLPKYRAGGPTPPEDMYPADGTYTYPPGTGNWVMGCVFTFHMVVTYDNEVYDATLHIKGSTDCPAGMSRTDYKNALYYNGYWTWVSPDNAYVSCD